MLDAMDCLRDGIPLSLMMDLFPDTGPDTSRIYAAEPADTEWVPVTQAELSEQGASR